MNWTRLAYLSLVACQAWIAWRAESVYRALLRVRRGAAGERHQRDSAGTTPWVSVIIPARNEADNIARILTSLPVTGDPNCEVIVVDDDSSDGTGAIAAQLGARVVRTDGPLLGWYGKPYACHTGAGAARGDWLLFTDADTVHSPGSIAEIVTYAETEGLDSLSLLLQQECGSFWERLLLPFAYQVYFAAAQVESTLNGQYWLVRHGVYDRIGGFTPVRHAVMEDLAMGRLLVEQGIRSQLARGEEQAQVRMYSNLAAIVAGFTKTAFHAILNQGARGVGIAVSQMINATSLLLVMGAIRQGDRRLLALSSLSWLTVGLGLRSWYRRFKAPAAFALLHPLASAVFSLIALWSAARVISGQGVLWKGRRV